MMLVLLALVAFPDKANAICVPWVAPSYLLGGLQPGTYAKCVCLPGPSQPPQEFSEFKITDLFDRVVTGEIGQRYLIIM